MKVLIYGDQDGYGGGDSLLIAMSTDDSKLEAKKQELLLQNQLVDANDKTIDEWKTNCQEVTRQFLQRNRHALIDPVHWWLSKPFFLNKKGEPLFGKALLQKQDQVIEEICRIRWLSFVGDKPKLAEQFINLESLIEPCLVLPHSPSIEYVMRYDAQGFSIVDVPEL